MTMRASLFRLVPLAGIALAGIVLPGCALRGDRADRAVTVPAAWSAPQTATAGDSVDDGWWLSFGNDELDTLVRRARQQSLDLASAVARVQQAQARAAVAGAPLWPELNARADVTREGRLGGDAQVDGPLYGVSLFARYEVDLWGRYRSLHQGALQDLRASRFDRDTVQLTVTAGVADTWLQAQALRERGEIAGRNLDNARRVLRLVEARGRAGAAGQLELAQQRALVAAQERALPALRQQERDARTALAVLLGEPAPPALRTAGLDGLQLPDIGAGTPSTLLARRPDIARAEARLAAADANVAAARAALLPSVNLGVGLGYSGLHLGSMFDGPVYTLAAGLLAPIFDGGRLAGNRDIALAQRTELLADYRAAIVNAFADTEVALSTVAGADAQALAQAEELAQARRAVALSEARYRAGAETLLTLLDSQRTFYAAQDLSVQLRLARLRARVAMYRALGGGWGG